jgi:hypothetical protein
LSGCLNNLNNGPLQDAENRYFVDADSGDDGNTGLRATPLATIQAGIDKVAQSGGEVIVAGGTYRETVHLVSALDLRGGFDPSDWTYDPENFPSVIWTPSGDLLQAVIGMEVSTVLVQGFTLTNESADRGPSQKFSIAVRLHNCLDVTIDDNVIFADSATNRTGMFPRRPQTADGDDGDDGDNAPVCTGFASRQPGGRGGSGGPGNNGGDGGSGAGFTDGNETPTAGEDGGGGALGGSAAREGFFANEGQDGNDGNPGADGDGGAGIGRLNGGDLENPYTAEDGEDGEDGEPGRGGGGGGGGLNSFGFCGGSGGGGGEGGAPGEGGYGGFGGEPCFGIMITASEDLLISGNTITTEGGGRAVDGGQGGLGGLGGLGGEGGNAPFGLTNEQLGNDGGDGGNGGTGGWGGGGGGGPSIGIVEDAGTTGTTQRGNTFSIGPAGTPGQGGPESAPAEPGIQAEYYKVTK